MTSVDVTKVKADPKQLGLLLLGLTVLFILAALAQSAASRVLSMTDQAASQAQQATGGLDFTGA